jgi:prepilin-type N-terminal cleavage/methylation domain-containing protein
MPELVREKGQGGWQKWVVWMQGRVKSRFLAILFKYPRDRRWEMLGKISLKRKLRDQQGFTLIEIIAVLVILAVLAVVAVPKYMDMIADSKNKAAIGGVAEGMGRVNTLIAKYMLSNNGQIPAASTIAADTVLGASSGDFALTYTAQGTTGVQVSASATAGNASGGTATGVVQMPTT